MGYIGCSVWAGVVSDEDGTEYNHCTEDDLSKAAVDVMVADCAKFQQDNAADIAESKLGDGRAGHCFYHSRCGHGTGYFDEYFDDSPAHKACDRLQERAAEWSDQPLFMGDDGLLYVV